MKKLVVLLISVWIMQSCCTCKYLVPSMQLAAIAAVGVADEMGGESWKPKVGGLIGVESPVLEFNENSKVNTGLNVSFQGAGWEENYDEYGGYGGETYSGKVNMTYLNLPVLYNYESQKGIGVEAGLQPAFLLSAKDKWDGNSESYRDYMRKFDLGLTFGGRYKINEQMSAGVRAVFGMINTDNSESDVKDHNMLVAAYFSYTLPFPGKNKSGND